MKPLACLGRLRIAQKLPLYIVSAGLLVGTLLEQFLVSFTHIRHA